MKNKYQVGDYVKVKSEEWFRPPKRILQVGDFGDTKNPHYVYIVGNLTYKECDLISDFECKLLLRKKKLKRILK